LVAQYRDALKRFKTLTDGINVARRSPKNRAYCNTVSTITLARMFINVRRTSIKVGSHQRLNPFESSDRQRGVTTSSTCVKQRVLDVSNLSGLLRKVSVCVA
jgi:hypothetical protein